MAKARIVRSLGVTGPGGKLIKTNRILMYRGGRNGFRLWQRAKRAQDQLRARNRRARAELRAGDRKMARALTRGIRTSTGGRLSVNVRNVVDVARRTVLGVRRPARVETAVTGASTSAT